MPHSTPLPSRTGDRPRESSQACCQANDEVNDFLTRIDFIRYEGFGSSDGEGCSEPDGRRDTMSGVLNRNVLARNIDGLINSAPATTSKGPVANGW
jgi:hypothetical protein